jgi:diguanylate cyclase (GGDEF)-like protein/hemerythrin-like metal-binding protein
VSSDLKGFIARFGPAEGVSIDELLDRVGGAEARRLQIESSALLRQLDVSTSTRGRMRWRTLDGTAVELDVELARLHQLVVWSASVESGQDEGRRVVSELRSRIEELERQVMTDRLTGAWNRRYLDRVLRSEIERSRRHLQPLSMAVVDIDHFKRVNDAHGHAAGDEVLREVVQRLRLACRASDVLVRWGGEEFLVLAPVTSTQGVAVLADRLRTAVAAKPIAEVGRVTVSVGAAEHLSSESMEEWFTRADEALYVAKEAGRNRVEVAEGTHFPGWDSVGASPALRLVWAPAYESGSPEIDDDHRELFARANGLLGLAFAVPSDPDALGAALDAFLAHVEAHFVHEERLLEDQQYRGLAGHRRLHHELLERAKGLAAAAREGVLSPARLVEFLARDVVAEHILKADRAFFRLFGAASGGP